MDVILLHKINVAMQAAGQSSPYEERAAIVLGVITVVLALAIFASCRTFASLLHRVGLKNVTQNRAYKSFNKYHSFLWWFMGVTLVSHLTLAFIHTGLPQAGDSDAYIHWRILGLGLSGAVVAATVFLSCRISPRLLTLGKPGRLLKNMFYRPFFGLHSYFWWFFIGVVAAHFLFGYRHVGIWPMG